MNRQWNLFPACKHSYFLKKRSESLISCVCASHMYRNAANLSKTWFQSICHSPVVSLIDLTHFSFTVQTLPGSQTCMFPIFSCVSYYLKSPNTLGESRVQFLGKKAKQLVQGLAPVHMTSQNTRQMGIQVIRAYCPVVDATTPSNSQGDVKSSRLTPQL